MKKIIRHLLEKLLLKEYFIKKLFFNLLSEELLESKTILELGAGKKSYLRTLNLDLHITALNIDSNTLAAAKINNVYDDYKEADVKDVSKYCKKDSFDAVILFDLIEHLQKKDGIKLIRDITEIARKKVIIYTPNGFLEQPPSPLNPFQEHLSGWSYDEMVRLGFKTYGINGHKLLRGMYALPKIKPALLGEFLCNLSWVLLKATKKDDHSFAILCSKTI